MRLLPILLCVALAGCVTTEQVPLPNGETGWYIGDCDGPPTCYKKAAELCAGKYEIVNQSQDVVGVPMNSGGTIVGTSHGMTIKCVSPAETSSPR